MGGQEPMPDFGALWLEDSSAFSPPPPETGRARPAVWLKEKHRGLVPMTKNASAPSSPSTLTPGRPLYHLGATWTSRFAGALVTQLEEGKECVWMIKSEERNASVRRTRCQLRSLVGVPQRRLAGSTAKLRQC